MQRIHWQNAEGAQEVPATRPGAHGQQSWLSLVNAGEAQSLIPGSLALRHMERFYKQQLCSSMK